MLNKQESALHKKLQILQINAYTHNSKIEFEHIRNTQMELLTKMLQDSVLRTTIRYLYMGLENNQNTQTECQHDECIQHIRVSHKENERKI